MKTRRKGWRSMGLLLVGLLGPVLGGGLTEAKAGEPDAKTYWNIDDVRPGMKGEGPNGDGRHEARRVRCRSPGRDERC